MSRFSATRVDASVFSNRKVVVLVAALCCMLWGSAYPAIKNGYELFSIATDDIAGKMVFAGYRFLLAGLVLLLMGRLGGRRITGLGGRRLGQLTLLGLAQTALQYIFFYIGLSYTTGVKASILNATGTFFSVLLAHFIYKNDRLSHNRILGCLVGFTGVMVVNLDTQGLDFRFTLLGEGCIVAAAFVLSAASIYGKKISQGMDAVVMTGYQLAIGGFALILLGYGTGGTLTGFTWASSAMLAYLVVLSAAAFSLWSILLKYNPVGTITIFNFLIPIFGSALSALFLNESILEWKNAIALLLVCFGIWRVTAENPAIRPVHRRAAGRR